MAYKKISEDEVKKTESDSDNTNNISTESGNDDKVEDENAVGNGGIEGSSDGEDQQKIDDQVIIEKIDDGNPEDQKRPSADNDNL